MNTFICLRVWNDAVGAGGNWESAWSTYARPEEGPEDGGEERGVEWVFVFRPDGIKVVAGVGADFLDVGDVEVEEVAASALVDHPDEGEVGEFVVGFSASHVAVVACVTVKDCASEGGGLPYLGTKLVPFLA